VSCCRFQHLLVGNWLVALACVSAVGANAAARIELHRFDWNGAIVPASVCGFEHPLRLRSGFATAYSRRWPALSPIEVARGHVVYGDLRSGRDDAAALQIVCVNRGGTAAGQLAFAVIVYSTRQRAPKALAVLRPRLRSSGSHVPILTPAAINADKVVLTEFFYGPHDADCCPTGKATTVWRLQEAMFRPASTVIQRKAKR
jgi:hypothetical protein